MAVTYCMLRTAQGECVRSYSAVPYNHHALIAVNTRLVSIAMAGLESHVPKLGQLVMLVMHVVPWEVGLGVH